jgi:DHA3 family macrolide efflux protein-like MFS transporter
VAIHLGYLALIDVLTYVFSVLVLVTLVQIPSPPITLDGDSAKGSLLREMRFGWDYITARRGLLALLMFFVVINFLGAVLQPLYTPLVLDTWNPAVLGYISTIMGAGMLAGTLVMSAWGGGKRKVYTLLGFGVFGSVFLAGMGLRASIPLLAVGGFGFMFSLPFMNASSQAIWQAKVAPDVQGRVFAIRRAIAWSSQLIGPLLAAPLADGFFKPGMDAGGRLAPLFGPLLGVGPSRGVGLMVVIFGLISAAVSLISFASRSIRNVEIDLPDHVAEPSGSAMAAVPDLAD